MQNCAPKASSRPLFILINNPKQLLYARNSFKKRYFERGSSKNPGTSDQSLLRLRNKFTKISLILIYYLTKFDGEI